RPAYGELVGQRIAPTLEGGGLDHGELDRRGLALHPASFPLRPTGRGLHQLGPFDLGPHRPEHPQEEEVEERQQAQLEDREELLVHDPCDSTGHLHPDPAAHTWRPCVCSVSGAPAEWSFSGTPAESKRRSVGWSVSLPLAVVFWGRASTSFRCAPLRSTVGPLSVR